MCSSRAKHQPSLSEFHIFTISKLQTMKKTYIIPNVLIVELGTRNHLMDVSYRNEGNSLGSMSFDTVNGGDEQLTKESKSLWDSEW